jgi:8-oxo-dGTP diphosphatase
MEKIIRNAVRCFLIKDNKVVAIKYNENNKKAGYYDIPGGKIEECETPEQAAIREVFEETGIEVMNLKYKGVIHTEYPDRLYILNTFITSNFNMLPQNCSENTSVLIEIDTLLKEERKLSNLLILERPFIKSLIDKNFKFEMYIKVDENENILEVNYKAIRE